MVRSLECRRQRATEWMDGWREHCVPPARGSDAHIVPGGGRVVIYDSRAPATRRTGTGRGRCDVPAARFSENVKSNMHETVTGGVVQQLSPAPLSVSALSFTLLENKKHQQGCIAIRTG